MDWTLLDWPAVALLGGLVGASELVSRYKRDDTFAPLKAPPGIVYIAINAAASVAALGLIRGYHWFGASRWTQVLMAGVSAMAFFRTSLFVVRAGDRDVGVGPSGFLQIFLAAADRALDRNRAAVRSDAVVKAMEGIDFDKALRILAPYCIGLMQNLSPEDQEVERRFLDALKQREEEPSVKVLLLGIELMNVVGEDVLTAAVSSLGDQIRSVPRVGGS